MCQRSDPTAADDSGNSLMEYARRASEQPRLGSTPASFPVGRFLFEAVHRVDRRPIGSGTGGAW